MAKSVTIQAGQPICTVTLGATRIRLASKNFVHQFSFPLQKNTTNGHSCALDCANNPLMFIRMVHT
jgi:hypothetical protein